MPISLPPVAAGTPRLASLAALVAGCATVLSCSPTSDRGQLPESETVDTGDRSRIDADGATDDGGGRPADTAARDTTSRDTNDSHTTDCDPLPPDVETRPPLRKQYVLKSRPNAPRLDRKVPPGAPCFDPPFDASDPGPETPTVSEWTETAGPGDTIVVRGTQFTHESAPEPHGDTEFVIFGRTSDGAPVVERVSEVTASPHSGVLLELPESLPEPSMYVVWPVNARGSGRPFAINRPELWWSFQDEPRPGDTVSLFGRELQIGDSPEDVRVYIEPKNDSSRGRWLEPTSVDPYRVAVDLPENLSGGTYRAWVHNGHGGRWGWAGLHSGAGGHLGNEYLKIDTTPRWSTTPSFDVTNFGADGTDRASDSSAIDRAVQRASEEGRATVHFPEGTFFIDRTISGLSDVRLKGAGRDSTEIRAVHDAGLKTMIQFDKNLVVRDIKLHLNARPYPDDSDWRDKLSRAVIRHEKEDYDSGLRVENAHINAQYSRGFSTWKLNHDVVVRNSKIAAKENTFGTPKNSLFANNTFLLRADAGMAIYSYGGWNMAIRDNKVRNYDYDPSNPNSYEQGVGRFYACTCGSQRQDNVYIGGNETENLTVRPEFHDQNMGEQLMWESKEVKGAAGVKKVDGKKVWLESRVSGGRNWYMDALIVSGPGAGQTRQIGDWHGDRFELASVPWRVPPTDESEIRILEQISRVAIHDNDLDAKPRAYKSEDHIADSGVQPWLPSYEVIVDDNRFHEIRAAIVTRSSAWKLQVMNNRIDKTRVGVNIPAGDAADGTSLRAPGVLGSIVRDNEITGVRRVGYHLNASNEGSLAADLNVVEDNDIRDVPVGLKIGRSSDDGSAARRTAIRDNELERGSAPRKGSVGVWSASKEAVEMSGNRISGFESTHATP